MFDYRIFVISKDLYKEDPGLSQEERETLQKHLGYHVAAEYTERGYRILVKSISDRREEAVRKAERLLKEGY
jgi:hypothetical protein